MKTIIFATFVVLATIQMIPKSDAFIVKTISIQKGYSVAPAPTLPSADASIAAYSASKNALIQSVANAVTEKVNAIASIVNSVVQAKARAKQEFWRSTLNAVAAKPVYTKTITFGYTPLYYTTTVVPAAPPTTAATGVVASTATTTTAGGAGGSGGYRRRRAF